MRPQHAAPCPSTLTSLVDDIAIVRPRSFLCSLRTNVLCFDTAAAVAVYPVIWWVANAFQSCSCWTRLLNPSVAAKPMLAMRRTPSFHAAQAAWMMIRMKAN